MGQGPESWGLHYEIFLVFDVKGSEICVLLSCTRGAPTDAGGLFLLEVVEEELERALVVILNERLRVVGLVLLDSSRSFKGSVADEGQDMEDQVVVQFVQPLKRRGGGSVVSSRPDSPCRPSVFGARGTHRIDFPTRYCFLLYSKERGVTKRSWNNY